MKLIIAGGRGFNDYDLLEREVLTFISHCGVSLQDIEIVSGGASGADKLGEIFANRRDISFRIFPANWKKYGRAAGPIRNQEMAKYSTHLIAFWNGESKGTKNMITVAKKSNLVTKIIKII